MRPPEARSSPARRTGRSRHAIAVAVVTLATLVAVTGPVAASPPPSPPPGEEATTTTTFADNEFIPENVNLSDCISGVPRPGCGSEARGGWRQSLVFVAMAAGLAFIGWRIIRSARRNRPDAAGSDVQNDETTVAR